MMRLVNTFICARCGGTFEKGWGDREALEESSDVFGRIPREDLITVCDDCYRIVLWRRILVMVIRG